MQGQESQGPKVVSIFTKKKTSETQKEQVTETQSVSPTVETGTPPSFSDVMKQNQVNKDRIAKERASANKSVLRSYRIKH